MSHLSAHEIHRLLDDDEDDVAILGSCPHLGECEECLGTLRSCCGEGEWLEQFVAEYRAWNTTGEFAVAGPEDATRLALDVAVCTETIRLSFLEPCPAARSI